MVEAPLKGETSFIQCGTLSFCIRRWGNPMGPPVLALHGWLDNCASFLPLAQTFTQCHLVALDSAGHGHSSAREGGVSYNLWHDVGDVFRVADQLGWKQFHLLGHSRGAMIAFVAAGTFPERVLSAQLLDAICPFPTAEQEAPDRLAQSISECEARDSRPRRYYSTKAAALKAREGGFVPVSSRVAGILAEHGLESSNQGLSWTYDPLLTARSEVGFTLGQIEAFAARFVAPVVVYLARSGLIAEDKMIQNWLNHHPSIRSQTLEGDHYFHMDVELDSLANALLAVIQGPQS